MNDNKRPEVLAITARLAVDAEKAAIHKGLGQFFVVKEINPTTPNELKKYWPTGTLVLLEDDPPFKHLDAIQNELVNRGAWILLKSGEMELFKLPKINNVPDDSEQLVGVGDGKPWSLPG